jgi:NAD(P)-dependent dehydrogenase (short-subunit alcohol dehydrogenase family)
MGRLQDKVAVVTGGAMGLGQAVAERFAAEGAKLALGDINADALEATAAKIAASGAEVTTLVCDVTEEANAIQLIGDAITHYGHIDILVNVVGGSRNTKIWEMSVEDWDHVMRLNLRGTFLCTRQASQHMMKRRQGKIICFSSGAREGTPWSAYYSGASAYSTVKAGVHGFIRDVSMELAEYNINVNAVAPGPINTERVGAGLQRLNETVERSPNMMTPMGRLGEPSEVADAVLFLATDEASYISGHTIAVAGGR